MSPINELIQAAIFAQSPNLPVTKCFITGICHWNAGKSVFLVYFWWFSEFRNGIMIKQEQVLQIDPQNELKFTGETRIITLLT